MTPLTIRNQSDERGQVTVPCGNCELCFKRRHSAWSFRLMQEEKVSTSSIFITLTYDTSHVPITRNGFKTLDKTSVQKFMKRLRKAHTDDSKLKYYLVGEYGKGKTKRPHYHLLLFNADIKLVQPAWNLGHVHYGQVTGASIGYTLKYMTKVGTRIPMHRNDDRQPEFALMSKGLGISYINDKMINWHKADADNRMYCNLTDGRKITMPRYYKQKLYTDDERKKIGAATRQKLIEKEAQERANYVGDYDRDRTEAHLAGMAKLARKAQTDGTL